MLTNFPKNVRLLSTKRYLQGGASIGAYANFNLATHTGDDLAAVAHNRNLLSRHFNLPAAPKWLEQVHSDICLDASSTECVGDGLITDKPNVVCAILTADCLPIFASNHAGTQVGVAHAGWQGILAGVIESFVAKFNQQTLHVHFGAAISQKYLTLNADIYSQFISKYPALTAAFIACPDSDWANKYQLDIYQAATIILHNLGVNVITGGSECTYTQSQDYFSYRRDLAQSGRHAHLIWIATK